MWGEWMGQIQQGIGAAAEFVLEDEEEEEGKTKEEEEEDKEDTIEVDITPLRDGLSSWAKTIQSTLSTAVTPEKEEEKIAAGVSAPPLVEEPQPTETVVPPLLPAAGELQRVDPPLLSDSELTSSVMLGPGEVEPTKEVEDTVAEDQTDVNDVPPVEEVEPAPVETVETPAAEETPPTPEEHIVEPVEAETVVPVEVVEATENTPEPLVERVKTPPPQEEPPAQPATTTTTIEENNKNSETQLLRFQQMLSEELEGSEKLRQEKETLKKQVEELQSKLQSAEHELRNATSAEEVALLIDRLGQERQRGKLLIEDKKKLVAQVEELEAQVRDYQEQEVSWRETQHNDSSVGSRIIKLEEELERRRDQVQTLQSKLIEEKQLKQRVLAQLESLNQAHKTALEQAKQSSSTSADFHQRKVLMLEGELQSQQARYQEQIAQLESSLSAAFRRADEAEAKLTEVEASNARQHFPDTLRAELEQSMTRESRLQTELRAARSELMSSTGKYDALAALLNKERETVKELESRRREESEAARQRVEELETAKSELSERVEALEREKRDLAAEVHRLRTTAPQATNSPVLPAPLKGVDSVPSMGASLRSTTLSNKEATPTDEGSRSFQPPRSAFFPPPNFADTSSTSTSGAAATRQQQRLESELLRKTLELDRLRRDEVEHVKTKAALAELNRTHDLLLQMYGEMEEKLATLTSAEEKKSTDPPPVMKIEEEEAAKPTEETKQ